MKPRIMIVEDERISASVMLRVIRNNFDCVAVSHVNGFDALEDCRQTITDLILVDYQMPGMNGVDFIRRLRLDQRYEDVPIVMITAENARELRISAIEAGATDFLNKPVDFDELRVRARNLLHLRQTQIKLSDRALHLAEEVELATREVLDREEEVIWRLARAIEFRDGGTGEHIARVASISLIIAEELGLPSALCRNIYLGAPLHDVGKLGIPDSILNKPGKLTPAEYKEMQQHVSYGRSILDGSKSDLLQVAAAIASAHHEKWDGSGYPEGLSGEAIPIEGRVVALADVFDALCTRRSYKAAWHPKDALEEIRAQCGHHFDPQCVAAFEKGWSRVLKIIAGTEPGRAAA